MPPVEPFTIGFRDDGLDLPVPVPRSRASLAFRNQQGDRYFDRLDRAQPGESTPGNCLPPVYQRTAWQKEGPVQSLRLIFQLSDGGPPLIAEFERPAAEPQPGTVR